jgi:ATP-binding cassette, subfamily B, bacterial
LDRPLDDRETIPPRWKGDLEARLGGDETVVAWFAPDLDSHLQYAEGLVVLTDHRLLSFSVAGEDVRELDDSTTLKARDRAGLGTLEHIGPSGLLGQWRYTIDRGPAVHRLVERFELRAIAEEKGPAEEQDIEATEPPAVPTASSLLRLLKFARPRAGAIALGFVLSLASTAAGLVPPYLTIPLVDEVLHPRENGQPVPFSLVWLYLGGLAGAAVLAWVLSWARTYVIAWVGERISADLRNYTYKHLHGLSLEFFGGKRTGDLMARISSDSDRICSFLSVSVLDFVTDILMVIGTAIVLLAINPWLALATLAPFPVILWLTFRVRDRLRGGFQVTGRAWAEITSVLADTIPGIRVVKAFAQGGREVERFRAANDRNLKVNDRVNATWAFFGPMVGLLTQGGLLVVWGFGAWLIFQGRITTGVLLGFQAYIIRFYTRLESLSRMVQSTQRAAASAQRIWEILDRVSTVPEPARPVDPGEIRGEIVFQNVGFRYGNRRVLQGVDLTIKHGEMIGLVGPSGAGKSTLVNLVCRFYDVSEGAILVDGVDLRRFPVEAYRRHIGLVLQEPFLFFGSIAENIAYGRPEATLGEIIAAARAAKAHEFILKLTDGYDTLVGERGQSLSGGERQRISMARALLIDPKILILDEATSSVDTETEREIQEALDNLVRGRTTIAVAHRLSTLRKADRLVVLENGRIVEVGPHQELLEREGTYFRLHRAQAEMAKELAI